MRSTRHWFVCGVLAVLLTGFDVSPAGAFLLNGDGSIETPAALYASAAGGKLVKILQPGAPAPGGGTISELGVPSRALDGTVVFGAEVTTDAVPKWKIFRASLSPELNIEQIKSDTPADAECRAVLKFDPQANAGPNGSVVFISDDSGGHLALFAYSDGKLHCLSRSGDATANGHVVENIVAGSAQIADNGSIIVRAVISNRARHDLRRSGSKGAILLVEPSKPPQEIAVEGAPSPSGKRYGAYFGLPAITNSGQSPTIAFTNYTSAGVSLFVGTPDHIRLSVSTRLKDKRLLFNYISETRPALADDGSVAVSAACDGKWSVLLIRAGEAFVVAREGDQLSNGQVLIGLGSISRMAGGTIVAEALDQLGINHAYLFPPIASANQRPTTTVLSNGLSMFPSAFTTNSNGQFALLSRERPHNPLPPHKNGLTRDASL